MKVLLLSTWETGETENCEYKQLDFEPTDFEKTLIEVCTKKPTRMSERVRGGGSHYFLGMYFSEGHGDSIQWTPIKHYGDGYDPYKRNKDDEKLNLDHYDLFLKAPQMSDTTDTFNAFAHYLDDIQDSLKDANNNEYDELKRSNPELVQKILDFNMDLIFDEFGM